MGLSVFSQGIATVLIALGLGYIVCNIAAKEKGALKLMGYLLGGVTVICSVVLLANTLIMSIFVTRQIRKDLKASTQTRMP